ncbi:succinate dehydrogenase/fumarate reductase iron-sulfur subunit [Suttonella sp. R2A3]|uniref:succinate dehydrogenase/fumarate reductase iron-sulfur subunit n=1 Tax=Suttonella sp. R2A3 TaxID=2908648 RepID=UPI001F27900E|nr:succinate dehydrogenase/fumarate reductase iron-sulfur subunit [Suttonella sp. R2A3]UJF25214.1 succinate dehydrogenase/fumarate reductase iron-sulfur subunit [Suttonella sp. R2A3]
MSNTITLEVMRYRPDQDDTPWAQTFDIEWTQDMSILDALGIIKDDFAPELAYRWSCRMEVCGSCGMVVNGVPKLACSTFVRDYADEGKITIAPLDQMPVEKDLVVDVNPFVEKLASVTPYIVPKKARSITEKEYKQTPKQLAKFKQYTMCINCMLCYQACPQIGINADFLGPAAISLAHRYNLDNRDAGSKERFKTLNKEDGVWPCTFVGYCSEVCPKHVDPAGAIQQAKAQGVPYWALSWFSKESEESAS